MSAFQEEIEQAVRKVLREELPRLLRERAIPPEERSTAGDDEFLTIAQAAEASGFNVQTIREKCRSKEIDGVQPGGGRGWRIRKSALTAWLTKGKEQPVVDEQDEVRKIVKRMRGAA